MIYKLPEIEISQDNPFKNCKLNREQYASILTSVVESCTDGCVLAINGEWGSGKTTFVKMWREYLEYRKFKTLYFNVWEHDFVSDPIIGLVSQFRQENPQKEFEANYANLVASTGKFATAMLPALIKGLAKKYVGEEVVDVIEAGAEAVSESFQKVLDDFKQQCDSMEQFKNALVDVVKSVTSEEKPLVFIVDELDRCNPYYAVKVLERIKHLFCVKNIVFVLSIDKRQLCNSICGFYGSEKINADDYLRRFIDIEYLLPEPDLNSFCNYVYTLYGFDSFFKNSKRAEYFRQDECVEFLKTAITIYSYTKCSLRQVERMFAHIRLCLQTFNHNNFVHSGVLTLLVYFKHLYPAFYQSIKNKEYSIQELVKQIEDILPESLLTSTSYNKYDIRRVVWEIAKLILCYKYNDFEPITQSILSKEDNPQLLFLCRKIDSALMLDAIKSNIAQQYSGGYFDLTYLIEHIELLSQFRN